MTTIAGAALIKVTFSGADASSDPVDINVPGVKAGDMIAHVTQDTTDGYGADPGSNVFAFAVVTDDYIRQKSQNLLTGTYTALLARFI